MKHAVLPTVTFLVLGVYACFSPQPARAGDKTATVDTLRKNLASQDDNVRYQAVVALQELGPKAAAAAPDLVQLFAAKNEDLRLNAAIALGKIGKAAVTDLKAPLAGADEDARYYALSAIGWIGPPAKELAPQVIASLNHKSESIRRKAAYALGSIAAAPDDAVAALVKLLADPNGDVRLAAGDALARFGGKAVPILLKTGTHKDVAVRVGVMRTLGALGADAKDAVPLLQAALLANDYPEYKEAGTSVAAADALAKIGKAGLPALSAGVKSQHADVRRLSVAALARAGGDGVPLLVDALGDANVEVRRQAAQLLGPLRISDKMVVLGLAYALKDKDDTVRQYAALGLLQLGAGAKLAAPHLLDALKDGHGGVRQYAVNALQNMRPDSPEVFKKLTQLAKDADAQVRQYALQLVTAYGADALPLVLAGLKDADNGVRLQAVRTLQTLQGDLRETLPLLTPLLKSEDASLRQAVVTLLGRSDAKAVPLLIDALKDPSNQVRAAAANSVRMIGAEAKTAAPALADVVRGDADALARRNAVFALMTLSPETLPPLLEKLKEPKDALLRRTVLQTAFKSPASAKPLLPFLIDSLKDTQQVNRSLAVRVLGNLGADAKDAVPALTALLNDPNTTLRLYAQQALKRIKGD